VLDTRNVRMAPKVPCFHLITYEIYLNL